MRSLVFYLFYGISLLLLLVTTCSFSLSQTVNIFIDTRASSYPNTSVIQNNYQSAGFVTVNITSGMIDASVTTANYDILIINEYYNYNSTLGEYVPNFLSSTQESIAQNFVSNGGHIIWIAESWNTSPSSGSSIAQSTAMINTVNSVFGQSIGYGPYFNNGGMGSPNMPRVHPSSGPGALSPSTSIISSGSYATLINVPSENAVYAPDGFDNSTYFDDCIHTTVALFPAFPTNTSGSIIVSTEVANPFVGYNTNPFPVFPPPPPTYNTAFDQAIAQLHFNLLTNASMTAINSWSSDPNAVNIDCMPVILPAELLNFEAIYSPVESHVDLLWQTASELNINNYTIERSTDLINWEVILEVESLGNSQSLRNYSTIDTAPLNGLSYYWLRSNDVNGDVNYSEVRSVSIQDHNIVIYPNPTTEYLKIIGNFKTDTSIEIVSNLGEVIHHVRPYDDNRKEIELSTKKLSSGSYFVRITTTEKTVYLPFTKID